MIAQLVVTFIVAGISTAQPAAGPCHVTAKMVQDNLHQPPLAAEFLAVCVFRKEEATALPGFPTR